MTSSFRDPNRMGATNYLSTESDLTQSVNKEIDNQIKDTREFYDQMAELEKQRYDQRFDNLALLTDFIKTAAPLVKQAQQANDDRNKYKSTVDAYTGAKSDVDDALLNEQNEIEAAEKSARNREKEFQEDAKKGAEDPTKSKEEKKVSADAAAIFGEGSFTYQEGLNSRNNLKAFNKDLESYYAVASKDDRFAAIDNRILNDASTNDEFDELFDFYTATIFQNQIRARRAQGLRDATQGEVRKYLAPKIFEIKESFRTKWMEKREQLLSQAQAIRNNDEVSTMFQNKATLANDVTDWVTNRKIQLEARGLEPSEASQLAFAEFGDIVSPMLDDVASGVDAGDLRALLATEFEYPGGTMLMNDPRAPKGAQRLHAQLTAKAIEYENNAIEQEEGNRELEMMKWKDTSHPEFLKTLEEIKDPRAQADAIDKYVLDFRKEFNVIDDDALPDFMKDFLASRSFADESIVVEITSRRRNNLPITQSMIDKIADPDIRDEQAKFVNTPELGAFTEQEAESMDERVVAIVKEAKQLRDLNQAKTDQYLVTRDNAKEYITSRFKELVIGGQNRQTAMFNAIKEAKQFVKDGDFDVEQVLSIDTQATKDLQSTLNAIGKDPSLIYSSEEWAGEAPHLAIAREYVRTNGRTAYPSYYMRFNFIKDADGAYLTPEEVFETRVNKVDKKEAKIEEIPERKELDNVDDQNKLLNKNNATKTLDVASKDDNIEWMIKTKPSVSELNAEMFIRQLEINIQDQHPITGIAQTHRQKTTLSKEDNDKLLEAVPELKEAPFLNPNTLSTAAINAMLKLNI